MPNEIVMTLEGSDKLMAQLKKLGDEAINAAAASLYQSAEKVMTKSKEICPVRTGALRSSGMVEQPDVTKNSITVTLGYGSDTVNYAVYVHENLDIYHKPPTQAKFLEQPLLESESEISEALIEDLNEAFGNL